ncbi:DUF6286 domain-containing protein [Streptomyces sp. NBC_01525]|uniref:DUF6286 domain-containing protein n=1 Tax=Streptomyces sp. NBC_01525 TaxID=2903893 RepID=UPI003867165E
MERVGRRWSVVLTAGAVVPCCAALAVAWGGRPLPGPAGPVGVLGGLLDGAVSALRLTDGRLIAGGAVVALLGVAMVVLALVPGGLREGAGARLLPGADAALDRRGLGTLLRDTALRVPGIARARVRVRGRRAVVRAVLVFGDPAEARAALTAELRALRDRLGLVRPPRLVIRIAPA